VEHIVDLSSLQAVAGHYVEKYNLVVAAGPVTVASVAKAFMTGNKAVNLAVAGGGVWFAAKELSGPVLGLIQDQFGYLQSVFAAFHS